MIDSKKIEQQLADISKKFNIENDIIHFLFFIGIQESGLGFREFTKDEKTDLIELGGATVLAPQGFYKKIDTDNPVPYYVVDPDKKIPEGHQRELLLKQGIVAYFENHTHEISSS